MQAAFLQLKLILCGSLLPTHYLIKQYFLISAATRKAFMAGRTMQQLLSCKMYIYFDYLKS